MGPEGLADVKQILSVFIVIILYLLVQNCLAQGSPGNSRSDAPEKSDRPLLPLRPYPRDTSVHSFSLHILNEHLYPIQEPVSLVIPTATGLVN